jgi:hypothetical protein
MGDGAAGETLEHFGTCWDGKVTNLSNPTRRDVAQLQANSYIVLQWDQDNPGIWVSVKNSKRIAICRTNLVQPLHCHIAWHLSAGFVWSVLERPYDLMSDLDVSDVMSETCIDWNARKRITKRASSSDDDS